MELRTVVCMKWGVRYPSNFVNRLWSMIKRHTSTPTQLICFTDDPHGIDAGVHIAPLPQINIPERVSSTPWRKLSLWQADLAGLQGDILFIDLDMVITSSIDEFFEFQPGRFCVIHNWSQPRHEIGNTSLFRIPVGKFTHIFDEFNRDPEAVLSKYRIEQQYISGEIEDQVFWPREWCLSFKHNLIPRWPLNFVRVPPLPASAKVIAFTGKPDPDEAAVGEWRVEKPWKRLYKHVLPTPWISEHWQ